SFSGFNVVGPTGSQFLTGRVPQRDGILCLACSNTHLRCSSSTASSPLWRCSGVTKRSLLCRCSVLYQRTNRSTHSRASSSDLNPLEGQWGRYFSTRNKDSAKALSLLTRGRLYEGSTPNSSSFAFMVCAFIGAPLSECSTSGLRRHCSRSWLR